VQSQNDGLSSSASEGSCSNVQTAIHPVPQRWASPHPSVQTQSCGAALERWVESTTKEPSVRLQGEQICRKEEDLLLFDLVNKEMINSFQPLTEQCLKAASLPSFITKYLNQH